MEKIFKISDTCDDCNRDLGRLFLSCRTCDKHICYDCLPNHEEHDYVPCRTLDNNKAMVIEPGLLFYGPPMGNLWQTTDIDSFISHHNSRCPHAINYFEEKNVTFFCNECNEWLCLNCLDKHWDHGLILHVGFNNGKKLRVIDPNHHDSDKELLLSVNAFKTDDGDIRLELEINNDNDVPLYDLRVMYTWKGLDETIWHQNALETIDNENFLCNNITQIEMIAPKETMKINHEFFVSGFLDYDLSSIITMVRFKDVFLGGGITIEKSAIKIPNKLQEGISYGQ